MSLATAPAIAGLVIGIAFVVLFSMTAIPSKFSSDLESVVITMERTPCFGACPAYSLAVYGNGTVIYEGLSDVAVTGRQTSQISQDSVRELINQFYKIDYFSLHDRHAEPISDLPSTTTSITINGGTKSVYRYGFGPEKLVQLEDKIDEIAGTGKWIKGEK